MRFNPDEYVTVHERIEKFYEKYPQGRITTTILEHSAETGFVDPAGTAAARAALACPDTRELLESYRAPLTAERFWRNLTGAVERTAYRYDRDPRVAQDCRPVG